MIFSILWILFAAWAISVFFYFVKIYRIARSHRLPLFAGPGRYNKNIRPLIKILFTKIFVATILFVVAVLLAYFVRFSSEQ